MSLNVKRIRAAIAFMRTVPREHFNMESWAAHFGGNGFYGHGLRRGSVLKTRDLNTCGTTACAAGWLATTPAWRRAGIEVKLHSYYSGNLIGTSAVQAYLGINNDQFEALFLCGWYGASTPKQWARMAEQCLHRWQRAERGA